MGYYDTPTVLASFLIALLAGFVAFEAVDNTRLSDKPGVWISTGGITLGLGIWSMHFTGMMAWHPPFPLYYTIERTVLSVIVAIGASVLALRLVSGKQSRKSVGVKAAGALLVGSGICAMHYIGMSALRFSGPVMWRFGWVVASIGIAVSASWAALVLLERRNRGINSLVWQLGASAGIAIAICGMHYSGMFAFMPMNGSYCLRGPHSFSGTVLAEVGVGNALIFAFALLVVSHRDKWIWIQMVADARLQAQEAVRKLQSMAAAGKIAASVAHEINNPLEAVGNLLYLAKTSEVGEPALTYLSMAERELRRISAITTHTLRFYKQQSAPTLTSIPDLFESALILFQNALQGNGIRIEKHWGLDIPQVMCREGEIRQVVANLVSNAIDAMPQGGVLQLNVKEVEGGIESSIRDTGSGVPAEMREQIMEPFFTTKGREGTGLGLPISAEIIARHGGKLSFTTFSEGFDAGTCFEFFLPYKPDGLQNPLKNT